MEPGGFETRVLTELVPQFCNHPSRAWGCEGFQNNCDQIDSHDASDFLEGLDTGVVEHIGRGQYLAPRSCAKEQFFNSGLKSVQPRRVHLAIEAIITVAALSRLHNRFGWPRVLLGTQSKNWEFDVVAHLPTDLSGEYIAGEVKKTVRELDTLLELMERFGERADDSASSPTEVNAYNKIQGLRARRAPFFWGIGPAESGHLFRVTYRSKGRVSFERTTIEELAYPGR